MVEVASLSSKNTAFHIEKLDGTNFPFWKEQIYNVLVQKKQVKPIKLKGVKPESMDQEEWAEMEKLARSIIMLSMTDYFLQCQQMCDKLWLVEQVVHHLLSKECSVTNLLA